MTIKTTKDIKLHDDQKEILKNIRKKLEGIEFVTMNLVTPSKSYGSHTTSLTHPTSAC